MKVLHVISSLAPRYGGPSTAVKGYASALADLGHEVVIATTDRDGRGRFDPSSVNSDSRVEVEWRRVHLPKAWAASAPLARYLYESIPAVDVVHIHSLYLFPTLAASRIARSKGVPYIIRPHGSLNEYHLHRRYWKKAAYLRLIEKTTLERAAAVHATSTQEVDNLRPLPYSLTTTVVPVGVEIPDEYDAVVRGNVLTAGFLGRLAGKKRPWLLVEALAEAPGVRAVVAGPDDEVTARELRRMARSLGVSNRIEFVGLVRGQAKEDFFREIDVLVLPSMDESFGIAVPEALARGRPTLLSAEVAVANNVLAAHAGWVVAPTAPALARQLSNLQSEPALVEKASARARKLAIDSFSWDVAGRQLERLYASVLDRSE